MAGCGSSSSDEGRSGNLSAVCAREFVTVCRSFGLICEKNRSIFCVNDLATTRLTKWPLSNPIWPKGGCVYTCKERERAKLPCHLVSRGCTTRGHGPCARRAAACQCLHCLPCCPVPNHPTRHSSARFIASSHICLSTGDGAFQS